VEQKELTNIKVLGSWVTIMLFSKTAN